MGDVQICRAGNGKQRRANLGMADIPFDFVQLVKIDAESRVAVVQRICA